MAIKSNFNIGLRGGCLILIKASRPIFGIIISSKCLEVKWISGSVVLDGLIQHVDGILSQVMLTVCIQYLPV